MNRRRRCNPRSGRPSSGAMGLRLARCAFVVFVASSCGDDGAEQPVTTGSSTGTSSDGSTADATESGSTGSSSSTTTTTGVSTSSDTTSGPSTGPGTAAEGTEASTGEPKGDQWAEVTITYSGPVGAESVSLDDCTFCDATVDTGVAIIRYQQAGGWTVWSVYIPTTLSTGTHALTPDLTGAYVVINEVNPDLSAAFHGFYPGDSNSGTLTLTTADLTAGGTVSGTIDASLALGDASADFTAEFSAVLAAL